MNDNKLQSIEKNWLGLARYKNDFDGLSFAKKLGLAQKLSDSESESDIGKLLFLYTASEEQVRNEILRVIPWRYTLIKAKIFIKFLDVGDRDMSLAAADLIAPLGEPLIIPAIRRLINIKDRELTEKFIKALDVIGDSSGADILKTCLKSEDVKTVIQSIDVLAKWYDDVSWKAFRELLWHNEGEIRAEAAFAIAMRKKKACSSCLIRAVRDEKDEHIKYCLLRYLSMVPTSEVLVPLLKISLYDDDQRARLEASRAIDRLQGNIGQKAIYKLRFSSDNKLRAEVIRRLGKFGTDNERYKKFIRKTLAKSTDENIIQGCIQSLGYIADSKDSKLLESFLDKNPMSSYNALMSLTKTWQSGGSSEIDGMLKSGLVSGYNTALSLTRTWRTDSRHDAIGVLEKELSPTQMQIILKYLIRRKGLSIDSSELLKSIANIIETSSNMNVRYLSLLLLQYSPIDDTLGYLLNFLPTAENKFEEEAVEESVRKIIRQNPDVLYSLIQGTKTKYLEEVYRFIPTDMDIAFYKNLAMGLVFVCPSPEDDDKISKIICDIFMRAHNGASAFLSSVGEHSWIVYFLDRLGSDDELLKSYDLRRPLVELLKVDSESIRKSIERLLKQFGDLSLMPRMIDIAEGSNNPEVKIMVRRIIKDFLASGVL